MKNIIIIIIAVLVGVAMGMYLKKKINRRKRGKMGEAEIKTQEAEGLEKRNQERSEEKEQRKERILNFMQIKRKTSNDEVQRALNVSDASAENYLDELEKEGKIRQVGEEGRGVEYEING